jgi:Bacterial transcriptional activator domain
VRISQLRKALGPAGAMLITRPPGYILQLEPQQLDLHRFEGLVEEPDAAAPAVAAGKLREALALWRGPPLADLTYESFAQAAIARLRCRLGSSATRSSSSSRLPVSFWPGPGGSRVAERLDEQRRKLNAAGLSQATRAHLIASSLRLRGPSTGEETRALMSDCGPRRSVVRSL